MYLEDVLNGYGVAAPYWEYPESVQGADPQDHIKALQKTALAASDGWRDELQLVDLTGRLPMFVQLGDIRAQRGNADTALKAYEAEVLGADDSGRLSELGYLLLQRCRVDEFPLCDKDFDGCFIDFGGDETLLISSHMIDLDDPGPGFPDVGALLNVAIQAFGLAYVRCCEKYFTDDRVNWDDRWHELVAIDGLRALFRAVDDLDGLDSVRLSFGGWVDDYYEGIAGLSAKALKGLKDLGHSVEQVGDVQLDAGDHFSEYLSPFVANFNKIAAYLEGRRKAPSPQASVTLSQMRELLRPAEEHLRTIGNRVEAMHGRFDLAFEKLIDIDQRSDLTWRKVRDLAKVLTEPEKSTIRDSLQEVLGDTWDKLAPESQEDLIVAEVVSTTCSRIGSGWHSAAIGYARVLERELKKTVKYFRERKVLSASPGKGTLGELIGALKNLRAFEAASVDKLTGDAHLIFEPRQITWLEKLNDISVRAKHPKEPIVSKADVRNMQKLLLSSAYNVTPLLAVVVQARDSR